ncbi:MAG: hypothetical protein LUG12_12880 [Erysipelotrichaceae bacterium]|nr:hypothetical protein [Erysipelotrichaceae bacterium]
MKKEDIEIISTYDLDKINLFIHYRINAPNKETVIADGYTTVDYDSWLYYNDDQYEQDNYLKNKIMNDVDLHKPDMNQMSNILKLCVSKLQENELSIYYDDMLMNDMTLYEIYDLSTDIEKYKISMNDLWINNEIADIIDNNDFNTPIISVNLGLLEYFDFKNYSEMDVAIEKYVDMVFECE